MNQAGYADQGTLVFGHFHMEIDLRLGPVAGKPQAASG